MNKVLAVVSFGFICLFTSFTDEIQIPIDTGFISGTLLIPKNVVNPNLVIIIPGSGPTDRNGNSGINLQTNCYSQISEYLLKSGIASFRFDKRGIGKSIFPNLKEEEIRFDTNVSDLIQILKYFEENVTFQKKYIIGHSEGSLVGILTAQKYNIDGLISISGPASNAGDLIIQQVKENRSNPQTVIKETEEIVRQLQSKITVENVSPILSSLFRKSVQPYLISWFNYTPVNEIKKLNTPVLIIQGDADIQVIKSEAELLMANTFNGKLLIIKNMTHTLKEISQTITQNQTYTDSSLPVSKELLNGVLNFIKN